MSKKEYHVQLTTIVSYYVEAAHEDLAYEYALDEAVFEYPDLDFDLWEMEDVG